MVRPSSCASDGAARPFGRQIGARAGGGYFFGKIFAGAKNFRQKSAPDTQRRERGGPAATAARGAAIVLRGLASGQEQRPEVAVVEVLGNVGGDHAGMLFERGGETAAHLGCDLVADVQELTEMRIVDLAGRIVTQ
jgi:hypothetical protein